MVKLNDKEIQDRIDFETGYGDAYADFSHPRDDEVYIPRNAHSKFRFEIEESVEDLIKDIEEGSKRHSTQVRDVDMTTGNVHFYGGETDWKLYKTDDGYVLEDSINNQGFKAYVKKEDDKLMIKTATSKFLYEITPSKDHCGSVVEYSGAIHGLLQQRLLPQMTYVSHTLEGKFVDSKTGEDLIGYRDMATYGQLRARKNEQPDEFGEKGNPIDRYKDDCAKINKKFNNEIPFFEKSLTKNERAQQDFIDGKKEKVREWKKERIRTRLAKAREGLSGVAVADRIAEDKISGKEKRTVTPEIGAELAAKIRKEKEERR